MNASKKQTEQRGMRGKPLGGNNRGDTKWKKHKRFSKKDCMKPNIFELIPKVKKAGKKISAGLGFENIELLEVKN